MVVEPIKPHNPTSLMEGEKQKLQMDGEIREMTAALAHRLVDLQRHRDKLPPAHGSSQLQQGHDHHHDHDLNGFRIITLTGSNTGAAMKGDFEDNGKNVGEDDALATYVNSNFQAINNSIMLGGSYSTHDPGVHIDMDIDTLDHHLQKHHPHLHAHMKHEKVKPKKKDKDTSKSQSSSD